MGFCITILSVCGLAAAGIVAYSVLFYRRSVIMGVETLHSALERTLVEEGEEGAPREEMLEALTYLKRRFTVVAALAAIFAVICLAASIVILALGTSRETGCTLLGVSWILAAGCAGLFVTRGLLPVMEEHLRNKD